MTGPAGRRSGPRQRVFLSPARWAATYCSATPLGAGEFLAAYLSYYAIALYLAVAAVSGVLAGLYAESVWQLVVPPAAVVLVYPFVEFLVHKYVLHNRLMYRSSVTAGMWRRLHYDHHMSPGNLTVLFGAPYMTLPFLAVVSVAPGYAVLGFAGAAAALCSAVVAFMVYEMCHCAAHLPLKSGSAVLASLRRHHMLHHYYDENGNFGVATRLADRALGTGYSASSGAPSRTVRNLGYTEREAVSFPWVGQSAAQSPGTAETARRSTGSPTRATSSR